MYSNSTRVTVTVTSCVCEHTIMVMNCSFYMLRNGPRATPIWKRLDRKTPRVLNLSLPLSAPPSRLFTIIFFFFFVFVVVIFVPLSFPTLTHTPSLLNVQCALAQNAYCVPAFQRYYPACSYSLDGPLDTIDGFHDFIHE